VGKWLSAQYLMRMSCFSGLKDLLGLVAYGSVLSFIGEGNDEKMD
jgi:hypothetical protein